MGNVPKGYKQTEVGVIPSDWEVRKLGEIADVATGNTPPTKDQSNYGNDFFFVSPADLGKGKYITDTEKKLSKKGFEISRKFPANSILFTCIGSTIGKSGIAPKELTSNQQINAIFPDDSFYTDYLFYALNLLSPRIKSLAGEQAVPIINKSEFEETLIPLPPTKAEQSAIAAALSDADALISSLEKLIAKKRNIKQGAMQQLLTGKKRLPGFSGKWEVQSLKTISSSVVSGKSKNKSETGIFTVFGSTGIIGFNSSYDYEGQKILIARVGANAGTTNIVDGKYCVSDNTLIVDLKKDNDFLFVFYFLKHSHLNNLVFGSGQPLITGSQLKDLNIPLPPTKAEQAAIAQILSDMDAEIEALEQKLHKYRMIKQGMMQKLLTGKTRLI